MSFFLDKNKGPAGPLSWVFEKDGQLTSCKTREAVPFHLGGLVDQFLGAFRFSHSNSLLSSKAIVIGCHEMLNCLISSKCEICFYGFLVNRITSPIARFINGC